jgi:hypothetical protein
MSHPEQQQYIAHVKSLFPEYFTKVKVLEIGSLDVNGTIRDHFDFCTYTGIDLGEGPGVDVVKRGERADWESGSFDTVISAECFEHTPFYLPIFVNMWRMSRGMVIFTCATTGRLEHGTVNAAPECSPLTHTNYYRNVTAQDFSGLPLDRMFVTHEFTTNEQSHDLYFWGSVNQ